LAPKAPQARVNLDTADWLRLSASTFENLCADMLRSFGFQNVQLLAGPGDKGRDILCDRMLRFGPGITTSLSWIVQCKHTVRRLTKKAVYEDLVKATEHKADFWWLLTTANITPALHDWIRASERTKFPFRINCLDRGTLSSALLGLPRLLGQYFPSELGPKEQVWVKVMSVMSNGNYQEALDTLRTKDDGVHPRISYLIACCLSMLARGSGFYDQLVQEAFQALEEAHRRGYILYMEDLFGWPENKCRSQVRLDPELSPLLKYDRERFLALFGPDASAGDGEYCLSPETMVRLELGVEKPIGSLKPGIKLVTRMAADPEHGEVAVVRNQAVSGTFLINSEVRASARHRFATIDGWRCAEELRIGDILVTFDGWRAVSTVTFDPNPAQVCQMVVLGRPCFYANGYLVHNDK
jgi:hypothetical protein